MADARYDEIMRLRAAGETYEQIGARLGISKERVRQIILNTPKQREREAAKAAARESAQQPAQLSDLAIRRLFLTIDVLAISIRLYNQLAKIGFVQTQPVRWYASLGDIAIHDRQEYKAVKGMGKLMLAELEGVLASHELGLGLRIPGWPLTATSTWDRDRTYRLPLGGSLEIVEFYDASRLRTALRLP